MKSLLRVTLYLVCLSLNTESQSRSFKLNNCETADKPLREIPAKEVLETLALGKPEAHSKLPEQLVFCYGSPFVDAVGNAFATHRPLRISPDHIWLVIAQGLATHVNNHPEELRRLFVAHEGTLVLDVRRDDFKKGHAANPWEKVFPEFSKQIGQHIGKDAQTLITATFSTTTPIEQAAFEITLMNTMKQYFTYTVSTFCGIPEIILAGTPEDWNDLRERTKKLAQYDLEWWTNELDPILEEFLNASEGRVDLEFWNSFYKRKSISGGPYINGWILKLFPYLRGADNMPSRLNPVFAETPPEQFHITSDDFPRGISSIPFTWKYYSKSYDMIFMAGFIGISQDHATKTVQPEIGWIVKEQPKDSFWAKLFGKK